MATVCACSFTTARRSILASPVEDGCTSLACELGRVLAALATLWAPSGSASSASRANKRWLWRPLEGFLAHRLHHHILDGMRTAVEASVHGGAPGCR